MTSYTQTMDGLEFRCAEELVFITFTRRNYVAWSDEAPIDRFDVFRNARAGEWVAWCCDTLNAATKERRRKFAQFLNDEAA